MGAGMKIRFEAPMNRRYLIAIATLLACLTAAIPMPAQDAPPTLAVEAQDSQGPPPPGGPWERGPGQGGPEREGPRPGRPDGPVAQMHMPPGRWWNDPNIAETVNLTAAQVKKMDDIFGGARDHLIDLDAAVRKIEGGLLPLLSDDPIDSNKVMGQMNRLIQAKADLERATAEMLIDIRRQLTHDQWMKLSSIRPPRPPDR